MSPLELTAAGLLVACAGFGVGYVVGLVDGTRVVPKTKA